jgi:hypothetical protein
VGLGPLAPTNGAAVSRFGTAVGREGVANRQDKSSSPRSCAAGIVRQAWSALPAEHRLLLQEVGASQWTVVEEPLGSTIHKLLRSAGGTGLSGRAQLDADTAVAVWLPTVRIVVFNARHQTLAGLSDPAYAQALARTAWHEWGHALSVVRCTRDDVRAGRKLLELAPTAVDDVIRGAGYRPYEYTHELVANIYAALVERKQHNGFGRPQWLHQEIYALVVRVTGWKD